MKRTPLLLAVLFLAAAVVLGGCAKSRPKGQVSQAQPPGSQSGGEGKLPVGVVARVNGALISEKDFARSLNVLVVLTGQEAKDNPMLREQLLDQLIELRIMEQEAGRRGLRAKEEELKKEIGRLYEAMDEQYKGRDAFLKKMKELDVTEADLVGFVRPYLVRFEVIRQVRETVKVDDAEARKFYDENKESMYTPKADVVRARHVLVESEEKAKQLAADAKAGRDFSQLAKDNSDDVNSGEFGGDLGYFEKDTMVKEFADAAFSMKVGEISDPIKTRFGYHIIKVEDKRSQGLIPFEAAKADANAKVLSQKRQEHLQKTLAELKSRAQIERQEPK